MLGIAQIEIIGRTTEIRKRDARNPFTETLGAIRGKKSLERRRDQGGCAAEHEVFVLERKVREQLFGFVGGDKRERLMRLHQLGRGCNRHRRGVGERIGGLRGGEHIVLEAAGLPRDDRLDQISLARERAVHGRPGAAGLASYVVERCLGQADPRNTNQRGVDEGSLPIHHLRQCPKECLIVNVSHVTSVLAIASISGERLIRACLGSGTFACRPTTGAWVLGLFVGAIGVIFAIACVVFREQFSALCKQRVPVLPDWYVRAAPFMAAVAGLAWAVFAFVELNG
jgi:hypothetical protein